MPNRMLKESIRTSKKVNMVSDFDFRVWAYLITYVDDFGRGSADPELLKGLVFPRRKGITESQITKALANLASIGMVALYEAEGEPFFYFPNWDKHQQIRAKKSRFPEPEIICNQMISDDSKCSRNPREEESESNTKEKRAGARERPPTLEEIEKYCRECNSTVDPQKFFEYFEAGGWKDSKGQPVRNWKQKLLTWEKYDQGKNSGKTENPKNRILRDEDYYDEEAI